MAEFHEAIEAQIDGANVRCTTLVWFDFKSGGKGYWPGFGDLDAGGRLYQGTCGLGTLTPMESGPSGGVDEMTFSIAGPPEILQRFPEDMEETIGRDVEVLLQFFDGRKQDPNTGLYVEWRTLDDPMQLFAGKMGPMNVRHDPGSTTERPMRVVSVTAQNAFINRSRAQFGWFTDIDQKARSPGGDDNMFALVSSLVEGSFEWPQF